jgi:hypothetical protein
MRCSWARWAASRKRANKPSRRLDQAYAEKDWTLREIKISPMLDPLRSDPRFAKLLKKLNLG